MAKILEEKGHVLVVNEEGEYEVEHLPSCPVRLVIDEFDDGTPIGEEYDVWDCLTGSIVDWYGFEDLKENDVKGRLKVPGRYPIGAYSYDSQSMFEDSEIYIYFIEEGMENRNQ